MPPFRFRRLTPGGRAAVACWEVGGPPKAIDRCLRAVAGKPTPRSDRVRLIALGPPPSEEAVAVRTAAGRAEVQTHGGDAVAERVRRLLAAAGGVEAGGETFSEECAEAFAHAATRRTARRMAAVCFGQLEAEVRRLRTLPAGEAAGGLAELLRHAAFGRSLTRPRTVALFGPPNAGKSSLLNRLAGYERSLTDPRPGATRDLVTAAAAVDGWPVELVDTAGLRDAADAIEQAGVERAGAARSSAHVSVLVLDRSRPATDGERRLASGADVVIAHKADRPDASGVDWPGDAVVVSSATGRGVDDLLTAIGRRLGRDEPPEDALFFVTERQTAAAERLIDSLRLGGAGKGWHLLLGENAGVDVVHQPDGG